MVDRPMIFSAPMVRALLDGRKTQTRRLMKPQPAEDIGLALAENPLRFAAGDRLWVREGVKRDPHQWVYAADKVTIAWPGRGVLAGKVRDSLPSIFMPRCASRLTLTVTDVLVQRLQDISEEDARAEQVVRPATCLERGRDGFWDCNNRFVDTRKEAYRNLWNSLQGSDAWAANPWVAAISFTVEHRNIDAGAERAEVVNA